MLCEQPTVTRQRWLLVAGIGTLVVLFFAFDLGQYLTIETLKASRDGLHGAYVENPLTIIGVFFAVYVLVTALSIPGATIMTLAGGAVFGVVTGTLVVSFASTIGATLAFLTSRYLMHDAVQRRFGDRLAAINEGVRKDGAFYLFTLRLVPAIPFFVINIVLGLTPLRARTFYWVSQIGMFPATVIYVNAGTQLASLESLSGILSPGLLLSFTLLGVFPLLAKKLNDWIVRRRVYRRWPRPKSFDRNLIVIGGGAAGLVTAYIGAAVKAKVTLIEGHKMGGDCLNFGCVPSKALLRSAKFLKQVRHAKTYGVARADVQFDFADVMARVRRVVATVEPHDSVERYTALGVDVMQGHARITSPWTVEVNGTTLSTRAIVIATGARPRVPDLPGLNDVGYFTSDTIWSLTALPQRLVVLGGGPIGCELAQAFARLGAQVTLVQRDARLMPREDSDAATLVEAALRDDGVRVLTGHEAVRCKRVGDVKNLVVKHGTSETALEFDALLCALGRAPRTEGFGLEELGIPTRANKTIETNAWLQTRYPNIYACGDVAGPYQFTHTAAHQAWYASVNALFGGLKRFKVDYSVIPWATFTDPEVARVGLSEDEAKRGNIAYELTRYDISDLDRAIADDTAHGFVKVLTVPGKDRILGVTIVGEHAADLLQEFVLAMKHKLGLNKILGTIHTYPTLAEANKYAAGEWKRAHAPQALLKWVARYHRWRRGTDE